MSLYNSYIHCIYHQMQKNDAWGILFYYYFLQNVATVKGTHTSLHSYWLWNHKTRSNTAGMMHSCLSSCTLFSSVQCSASTLKIWLLITAISVVFNIKCEGLVRSQPFVVVSSGCLRLTKGLKRNQTWMPNTNDVAPGEKTPEVLLYATLRKIYIY